MPFTLRDGRSDRDQGPLRRYATRYEPAHRDACLAWWVAAGPDEEKQNPADETGRQARRHFALLLDISHTGASVALDQIPDQNGDVWLRLEGDEVTEWTEARIVGMTITNRGPHLIRLSFRVPCAFETLRAAVCG